MSSLGEITITNFESEVLKSGLPVLVDFWAPWCGPCKMIAPIVEAIAADYKGKLKVVKLNTDENSPIAAKYQIMGIPTLVFFSGGKDVDRVTGYLSKEALSQKVTSVLSKK
jgi:thioredoxin 1